MCTLSGIVVKSTSKALANKRFQPTRSALRLSSVPFGGGVVASISIREQSRMYFESIGEITDVETIAVGNAIRDIARLRKQYGQGRWRNKLKGIATVRLASGRICRAEIHRYEAHGIGKQKFKIKRYLD